MDPEIPPLPPGFRIVGQQPQAAEPAPASAIPSDIPPLPPGFRLAPPPDSGPGSTALAGTIPAQGDQPARVMIDTAPRTQQEANIRQVESGVQGAGRGLADLAGAPVDLTTAALNLATRGVNAASSGLNSVIGTPEVDIPLIQKPFMGSEFIAEKASDLAGAAGVPVIAPDTTKEKFAYNTNRLGANAAGTVGALVKAAPQAIKSMIDPYLQTTARTIAGDIGASAGGGAAQTAVDVALPDELKKSWAGPLIEFAATTGGAVGGGTATVLGAAGVNTLKGLAERLLTLNLDRDPNVPINPATGQRYTKADVDQVAAMIQQKTVNPEQAARNIDEGANYYAGEGGPIPTSGVLSGDVGLIGLEKGARATEPVPFITRDQQVNTAAVDKVNAIAPENADPTAMPREVRRYADDQLAAADNTVAREQRNVDRVGRIREGQGTEIGDYRGAGVDASRRLDREIVNQALNPMDQSKRRRYDAVPDEPIEGGAARMHQEASQIRAEADALPPYSRAESLPAGHLGDFESFAIRDPETGDITGFRDISYQTAENMRPLLAAEITKQRKANASPRLLDNLEHLRRTVSDITNDHPAAAEANRFFNEDYAPVFGATAGEAYSFRKDVNKDRMNRSASPPSETAGRFLRPEAPETSASLERILQSMPDPAQAQAAARDYLMADLASAGALDRTGVIRPLTVRTWASKNIANLDLVPGLRDDINDIVRRAQKGEIVAGRVADELRAAQTNQRMTERQMRSGAFRSVIGADPPSAVAGIFNSNNPGAQMDQILSTVKGNAEAIDGFKAAVRDYLQETATTSARGKTTDGSRPVSFAKLDKLFNEHEQTLSKLFSPKEMNDLRAAHKFLAPLQTLNTSAAVGSQTFEKANNEFSKLFRAGLIARYGALKAGGIMKSLKLALESMPSNQQSLESLASQMFFDPKLASHLLTRDVSSVASPAWTKKLFTLMGVEAAARNENGED